MKTNTLERNTVMKCTQLHVDTLKNLEDVNLEDTVPTLIWKYRRKPKNEVRKLTEEVKYLKARNMELLGQKN